MILDDLSSGAGSLNFFIRLLWEIIAFLLVLTAKYGLSSRSIKVIAFLLVFKTILPHGDSQVLTRIDLQKYENDCFSIGF